MTRLGQRVRIGLFILVFAVGYTAQLSAAPFAALVMDARSGEILHSRNADTRLHPASLTKMMTLYLVFQAVEHGALSMDMVITVSKKAASEPPSKLGLHAGQKIKLRYLVRAAAVKSANDAATALGEAVAGSEAAFARQMTRTALALGMTRTTFKNAHGLTEAGHLSTAHDMTILGRHLFFDYPEYYNLFSRITTDAGLREVSNTNRRFLGAYKGADGIKTGYTSAAGFNLVASAERGGKRIIATVFGGRSTAQRNDKVAELLDLGFQRAPARAAIRKPSKPGYFPESDRPVPKSIFPVRAPTKSPFPVPRPDIGIEAPPEELLVAIAESIEATVTAVESDVPPELPPAAAAPPPPKPATETPPKPVVVKATDGVPVPLPRPESLLAEATPAQDTEEVPVVVERLSTSGERHWGINVGQFSSRYQAERVLLQTALTELDTLEEALRKVAHVPQGFDANFVGMTREGAALACDRLAARNIECKTLGPG